MEIYVNVYDHIDFCYTFMCYDMCNVLKPRK